MAHRLSPEAESDLDELWHYVASNGSVELADRLVDSLTTRFFLLGILVPAVGETIFVLAYAHFRWVNTSCSTDSTVRMC
jgi:hypothetical protein